MFKISNKLARLAAVSSVLAALGATMALPMTAYATGRTITIDNYLGFCKSLYGSSGYAYDSDRNGYYCGDAAHSRIPDILHYSQETIPSGANPKTIPGYVGG